VTPIILFRDDLDTENERAIASDYLPITSYRSRIPPDSLVIGRYSVLPFYRELERELADSGSRLINSHTEHEWIADVMAWGAPGGALDGLTPRSWSEWGRLPEGAYVVKGRTNSRKHQWNTRMFAPTKADIPEIASHLLDDALLIEQGIVVREYIPLRKLGEGLNGLPISNEWRTFWIRTDQGVALLGRGFYWGSHAELLPLASYPMAAAELAREAAVRVVPHAAFFVLDVAETADGRWIVIEVNDGQMSGLSMVEADVLYDSLAAVLS
jgi:hypothetical protein